MIDYLWSAIEDKFNATKSLSAAGQGSAGRIFVGHLADKSVHGPSPHVVADFEDLGRLDTFGTDIELYEVTFTIFSGSFDAKGCMNAMGDMKRSFDYCRLDSKMFTTVEFKRTGGTGPDLLDGRYQATMRYEVIIQLTAALPPIRKV